MMRFLGVANIGATPANIWIEFDNDTSKNVEAGSSVNASVCLNVLNDTGIDCSSLDVTIYGKERTKVHYTTTSGSGKNKKTHHHIAYGNHLFLSLNFELSTYHSGKLSKGMYKYPFSFIIPPDSPGTNNHASGFGMVYGCAAKLSRPSTMSWNVSCDVPFNVIPNAFNPAYSFPTVIEPQFTPIHTCCCFKRGEVVFGGGAPTNIVSPLSNLKVIYAAQNFTTVPIYTIHLSVQEIIRYSASGHHNSQVNCLSEKTITVDPTNGILKALDKQIGLDENVKQESLRTIQRMIESGDNYDELHIGNCNNLSYKGFLIQITHNLVIKLNTPRGTANPTLSANINIMRSSGQIVKPSAPPPPEENEYQSPLQENFNNSNWQPTIASIYSAPIATRVNYDNSSQTGVQGPDQYFISSSTMLQTQLITANNNNNMFDSLTLELTNSFDNVKTVDDWFSKYDPNTFTSNDFFSFYKIVNDKCSNYIQRSITVSLANKLHSINCESIASAARACDDSDRRDVIEMLIKDTAISDKQNKDVIKLLLSDFQFMCIERYFR